MSHKRVFVSDSLAVLQEACISAIQTLKAADPLTALTIIVPNDLLGTQLSQEVVWAGDGYIGLRFVTLADFAARITEDALAREGQQHVSDAAAALIVRNLMQAMPGTGFPELAQQSRLPQFFVETMTELKHAGIRPHQLQTFGAQISPQATMYRDKMRNLFHLYDRYTDFLAEQQLVDDADLFTHSAKVVETSAEAAETVVSDGPLLLYGCIALTALQRRLIEAIFMQHDEQSEQDGLIFLPWRPGSAYESVTPVLTWLMGLGFQYASLAHSETLPRDLARVATRLFERTWEQTKIKTSEGEPYNAPASADSSVHIISAPDKTREAREIARAIFGLVREQDYTFDEIGVLLIGSATYAPLLVETFASLGIPYTLADGMPLLQTRAGKAVQALCLILAENFARQRVCDFLWIVRDSFPERLGEEVSDADLAQWEALAVEAGIVRGAQEWLIRLAALEERYQQGERGREGDTLAILRTFIQFIDGFLSDAVEVFVQQTWTGWIEHFLRVCQSYVSWTADDMRSDSLHIEEALRGQDYLFQPNAAAQTEAWADSVCLILSQACQRRNVLHSDGVFLSDLKQAWGRPFRAVIIPGLVEESLATQLYRDPILHDADRQHLAEVLSLEVPLRRQKAEHEQLLFTLATQSAQEMLLLTYPRSITGAPQSPARLLLQIVSALCGRQAALADLEKRSEWVSSDPLDGISFPHVLDTLELHLACVERAKGTGGPQPVEYGLQTLPFFAPAARAMFQRLELPQLTAFDGLMEAEAVQTTLREHVFPHGLRLSASALESYARCPFRYFLSVVLHLTPWEEPEHIMTILPRDRGVLLHDILHDFFSQLRTADSLPLATQRFPELQTLLRHVSGERFSRFARIRPVGLPLLWEMEREQISRRLQAFLKRDYREVGFSPEAFEVQFGLGDEETEKVTTHFFPPKSVPFTLDTGEDVQLRGRIDRVDVDEERNCARILDYKTGKTPSGCFAGGTALQLSLYLFAAQYLRQDLTWVSSEYTSVDGSAQTQKSVFPLETLTSTLGTLRTIVTRLAEGISSGQFFLAPDSCMPCAFPQICGAHGVMRAGEKLQDQRTAAWRWIRTQA